MYYLVTDLVNTMNEVLFMLYNILKIVDMKKLYVFYLSHIKLDQDFQIFKM